MKTKKPTRGAKAPKSPAPKQAAGPSGKPRAGAAKSGKKLPPWMPESMNTPAPPRGGKRSGPNPGHGAPVPTRRNPHPMPAGSPVDDPYAAREAERYAQPIASREAILQLLDRCGAEGIARRQHHRFALRLILARQLTDGGGFTHTVYTDHQNDERGFTFKVERCFDFRQNPGHFAFQQAIKRLCIAKLFTIGLLRQAGNNAARRFNPHIRNQQLLFQLFEKLIIDLLATKQADKTRAQILAGFHQATFQAGKEAFFRRTILLLRH